VLLLSHFGASCLAVVLNQELSLHKSEDGGGDRVEEKLGVHKDLPARVGGSSGSGAGPASGSGCHTGMNPGAGSGSTLDAAEQPQSQLEAHVEQAVAAMLQHSGLSCNSVMLLLGTGLSRSVELF
jgi:hypothetical protein